MNSRMTVTIILAAILILVVMCAGGLLTYAGSVNAQKYSAQGVWTQNFPNAQSMKIIDLSGDGQPDLFIQNLTDIGLLDANGGEMLSLNFNQPLATTLGDVTGDGVEDIVALSWGGASPQVAAISKGQVVYQAEIDQLGQPARAAVIAFAGGLEIILGDLGGGLAALSSDGQMLWSADLSSGDTIRGLDDAKVQGKTYLAAANHDGSVALYDAQGQPQWDYFLPGLLRRLRSYDLNGDGNSEILIGGDGGNLVMLDAASGKEITSAALGQTITEIREAELNGDPASREFVVGGKDGGVWAFQADGHRLWSASVSDKVTEIAGMDIDGNGSEEVIIGDDSGAVTLFTGKSGGRFNLQANDSGITRIDAGKLSGSNQLAVADGSQVQLLKLEENSLPPLRYAPILVALIISVLIVVIAWFVATIPPKPALQVAIEDQSPESLQAQRRMLKESIADVDRLKQNGEMTSNAYLARLKDLRQELADNETALRKAGVPIRPETFQCPHCGGTLPLGIDRCDYCGQVVIT
jgi:outer membrane protein assembly factor BamB